MSKINDEGDNSLIVERDISTSDSFTNNLAIPLLTYGIDSHSKKLYNQ